MARERKVVSSALKKGYKTSIDRKIVTEALATLREPIFDQKVCDGWTKVVPKSKKRRRRE